MTELLISLIPKKRIFAFAEVLFLLFLAENALAGRASNSVLKISGVVHERTDRLIQFNGTGLLIEPELESDLDVTVMPLTNNRMPASSHARKIQKKEIVSPPAQIVIKAR